LPAFGQHVRERLARPPRAAALGPDGAKDVAEFRNGTIGQRAARTLGCRTPEELRNRLALSRGRATDQLVKLLVEANTPHASSVSRHALS
jgi:hypothetical protein